MNTEDSVIPRVPDSIWEEAVALSQVIGVSPLKLIERGWMIYAKQLKSVGVDE